jgi:sugar/nucleoside kinase (ribokinase family)
MKIAVIGTFCDDEITTHLGEVKRSWGGIMYNLAALESIIDDDTQIVPIAQVGYDHYDAISEVITGYRGVVTLGLSRLDDVAGATVQLVYKSITERTERLINIPPAITDEQMEIANDCDVVVVNFITGQEFDLKRFRRLRETVKGHLHLDIHNLIAIWTPEGPREMVGLPHWQEWLTGMDSVQMNEFEVELILQRKIRTESEYIAAAKELVEAGPKAVMLTLGPLGSILAYQADDGIRGCVWPASELGDVIDTTGCGDSFGAGFTWYYMQSRDIVWANAAANAVGGVNCITPGIGGLGRAKDMTTLLPQAFGDRAKQLSTGWLGELL